MSSIVEGNEEHMDNPAIIISLDGLRLILSYLNKGSLNLEQLLDKPEAHGTASCNEEQEPDDFNDPEVDRMVRQYYARREITDDELSALKSIMLAPRRAKEISDDMTKRGFDGWLETGKVRQVSGRIRNLVQKGLVKNVARGLYVWDEGGET